MFKLSDTPANPILTMASNEEQNAITFFSAGEEVLKISHNGFWLNGNLVDDTEQGRTAVYNSFKQWLVFQQLSQRN
jgi:hypothetical protein